MCVHVSENDYAMYLKYFSIKVLTDLFEKNLIQKLYLFWNYIHNYPVMIATVNKAS